MLRLTPLAETTSGQQLLKRDRVATLAELIQAKFELSPELTEATRAELEKLELTTLKVLFRQILRISTFEQLELWISDHLPENVT